MINIAKNNTNQHNHDELKIFQDYKWLIVIFMHTLGSILDQVILMRPWTLSSSTAI